MTSPRTGERIAFDDPPPIGHIVLWEARGRVYIVHRVEPHATRTGSATYVITWRSQCTTCRRFFTLTTGMVGWLNIIRCPSCRAKRRKAIAVAKATGRKVDRYWHTKPEPVKAKKAVLDLGRPPAGCFIPLVDWRKLPLDYRLATYKRRGQKPPRKTE